MKTTEKKDVATEEDARDRVRWKQTQAGVTPNGSSKKNVYRWVCLFFI